MTLRKPNGSGWSRRSCRTISSRRRRWSSRTRLPGQAPLAVKMAKHMMQRSTDISLERSLQDACMAVMIANPAEDVKEGRKAFHEKRKPVFQGR